jgi:hypothetical protein
VTVRLSQFSEANRTPEAKKRIANEHKQALLKIVIVVVLVLVLDKEPSEYDDENEHEHDPLDPAPMIAESGTPPLSCDVVPLEGA